jgi:predicted GNAT family N-acyltransferase
MKVCDMNTIMKFRKSEKDLFAKAFAIRTEVFVKGLNIDPLLEADEYDETAQHYLLSDDGIPVGTARWRETEKGIKLERFAVPASSRNKGIGSVLLKEVLADVIPLNKKIYLHSQHTAVNLYLKNGFVIEGPPFEEAGIVHYYMVYVK